VTARRTGKNESHAARPVTTRPKSGLCGKTAKLIKTDCCGNWICNDEGKCVIFSYARNSCHRNHSRFTLRGYHHTGGGQKRLAELREVQGKF
jgi:hypothetical protein